MTTAIIAATNMAVAREASLKRKIISIIENGELVDYEAVQSKGCDKWFNRQKVLYLEPEDFALWNKIENQSHTTMSFARWFSVGSCLTLALLLMIFHTIAWSIIAVPLAFGVYLTNLNESQILKWEQEEIEKTTLLKKYGGIDSRDVCLSGKCILNVPTYVLMAKSIIKNEDTLEDN